MSEEKLRALIDKILNEKKAIIVEKVHVAQEDIMTQLESIKESQGFETYQIPGDFKMAAEPQRSDEVNKIHEYTKEISTADNQLKLITKLLDGINCFCHRAALFLLRDDKLVGWKGKGFSGQNGEIGDEEIKKIFFSLSANTIFKYTLDKKEPYTGMPSSQPDDHLIYSRFGGGMPRKIFVLPFFVKGKPQAVVYSDAYEEEPIGEKEIEIIATIGEMSLDLLPLRQKLLAKVQTRKFLEDFHEAPENQLLQVEEDLSKTIKSNDPERKARVIINDIILYNQKVVEDGRQNQNLADILGDTISQAKEEYLRKFDDLAVFEEQLVKILAKGDREALKGYQFETL
jgi:hypothetical protein